MSVKYIAPCKKYKENQAINRLSNPKKNNYFIDETDINPYLHDEFNGLILTSINENHLRNNSQYAKMIFNMSHKA